MWRVVRVVEGAALEMLCSPSREPRVRIPNSPPLGNNTNVEQMSTFVFLIYTDFFAVLRKVEDK